MSEELFKPSEVQSESPKLRWMRAHGLEVRDLSDRIPEDCEPFTCALTADFNNPVSMNPLVRHMAYGNTADEAIANYARKHGLKLWNELFVLSGIEE